MTRSNALVHGNQNEEINVPKSSEQLRSMYLSGTVSIPPQFPELAEISFSFEGAKSDELVVEAIVVVSPKLTIKRSFFVADVSGIFEPNDPKGVNLKDGTWYAGTDVKVKARSIASSDSCNGKTIKGILYVRENAQSLLEVQAGLTAAESAEYYPPLPDDRSVNHYEMEKSAVQLRAGCRL